MSEVQHSIKVASRRTGLSPHVIRVWERRYDAVSPDRTDTNRRLYSEEEIERLSLLRAATMAGHSICNVARLPTGELKRIVSEAPTNLSSDVAIENGSTERALDECIAAIRKMNASELETVLEQSSVILGVHGLLQRLLAPLACKVGELWRDGSVTAAHEHFASAVIRNFLARHSRPYAGNGNAPVVVVATPTGQLHELGAVMASFAAGDVGWRVVYLGASLPALEIAGAALQNNARAVALSIVYPEDDT
ncbi:MAG TPA: MerR family transcriptional regulator, partial [Verrucomicrobiota bacterium]|nr:MerR family transcriptional regulator [Verrucomicrobiota bacterium]